MTLRPLRVWYYGRYWRWACRICTHKTRDLIPSLAMAYDDAVYHLEGHLSEEEEND